MQPPADVGSTVTVRDASASTDRSVSIIRQRDRSAFRATHSPRRLVPLSDGWALWPWVCLRGAGFAFDLLAPLGDPTVSAAADLVIAARATGDPAEIDRAEAAYQHEFAKAVQRLRHALHDAAAQPAFREAIAWQNRHALASGVEPLLRHDPHHSVRNSKQRDHEALVTKYLQRYCAKNDTIGFFGPVCWARFDDSVGIRVTPGEAPLAARTVFLEGWAVVAVLAPYTDALRPWLVPRRMPFVALEGTTLRVPLAPPVPLSAAAAAVLRACDGVRDARQVAAAVIADQTSGLHSEPEVFAVLADLHNRGRLVWQVEVPAHDVRPADTMRAMLARVTDEAVRAPALAALDELTNAGNALAAAAGDPQRVAAAIANLESTFTRLSGMAPTRDSGKQYAGRTLAYEECLRGASVHIGVSMLKEIGEALGLVLDSARWYTAAAAALVRRVFTEAYRRRAAELGTQVVPYTDVWLLAGNVVFNPPPRLLDPLVQALQRRWANILQIPAEQRRVRRSAAELRAQVRAAFPPGPPGWPTAVHHSPDLMLAQEADCIEWVLGEMHPGVNTLRYHALVGYHESPQSLRATMAADLGRGVVYPAQSRDGGGLPTRLGNALVGPKDLILIYARDGCGHDPARSLVLGECDVVETPAGLRVRRRRDGLEVDLMDTLGDLLAGSLVQHFKILPPNRHNPRVTIDSLVVSRESWTFAADEIAFATLRDEAHRFLQARTWAAEHQLPRHVFVRCDGERKPIYVDLMSLASIDLLARAVRQARRTKGDTAAVTVVEMLPDPDQLWLRDGAGQRYTAEFRVAAVDRHRSSQ